MLTEFDPVLEAIDHLIGEVGGHDLIPAADMLDALLDLRITHTQTKDHDS